MADVFEEVEEQLRAERYQSLFRRALPWIAAALALALAIALGVWGWGEWRRRQSAEASEAYAAALEAVQAQDSAKARASLARTADAGSPAYRSLALMQQAALLLNENQPRQAVPLLDEAADAAPDEMIGDAARLKAAFALMDYAPYSAVEERLRPLMENGRPYAPVAREALAMAKLQAGQAKSARTDFVVLSQALDVSPQLRSRAQAMVAAIDSGAAAQVPGILRAAAALPAQPAAAPPAGATLPAAAGPQGPAAASPSTPR